LRSFSAPLRQSIPFPKATRLRGNILKAGDRSERKSTVCGILSATADLLPIISSIFEGALVEE
jgi:hypothetical protein